MRSAMTRSRQGGLALIASVAVLLMLIGAPAQATPISMQTTAAGLSIGSIAEPTLFSPARKIGCEASPTALSCDSYTVTIRNEGGQSTGVARIGETQTCDPGVWDASGPPSEFKYQWLRDLFGFDQPRIVGNAQNYTITGGNEGDAGFALTCRVTATNASGATVAYSQPLRVAPLPKRASGVALGVPSTLDSVGSAFQSPRAFVAGTTATETVNVGEALVCDEGRWDVNGNTAGTEITLRYRWLIDGVPVTTEFSQAVASFEVPPTAEGKAIQCEVAAALKEPGAVIEKTWTYAASTNRVIVNPGPVSGEAPKLDGSQLTLADSPVISGVKMVVKDTIPASVTAVGVESALFKSAGAGQAGASLPCDLATLTCSLPVSLLPGQGVKMTILVTVQQSVGEIAANLAEVSGGTTPASSTALEPPGKTVPTLIGMGDPPFAIQSFSFQPFGAAGLADTQAGDRPGALTTGFQFPTVPTENEPPETANVKDIRVTLPPGLIGNPLATQRCPESKVEGGTCPAEAQVGAFNFIPRTLGSTLGNETLPVFNTIPEQGYPAEFGGVYLGRIVGMFANLVRAPTDEGGYTVQVTVPGLPLIEPISNAIATFFGDPAGRVSEALGGPALLTNPTSCGIAPAATMEADSWQQAGEYKSKTVPMLPEGRTLENCSLLQFGPSISMEPEIPQADTPSGYHFELSVPQASSTYPALATPPLRDAVVTLPEGLAASPASADGLVGCTAAQIDVEGEAINGYGHEDGQPHPTPGNCPLASKIATAEVTTPLLERPIDGAVYLGAPDCSPCSDADAQEGRLLKLYIEARDKENGIVIKLAGKVSADSTKGGRLKATFLNNPQFPFNRVKLNFKSGPRAALANPQVCGTYAATSVLRPWSTPTTPDATPAGAFAINSGPNGSACPTSEATEPNAPSFEAGTLNALAGSYSPLVMRLSRQDGTQRFKDLNLTLPSGLSGKLAGISVCSEAQIVAAAASSGTTEKASPSCPPASEVGTVTVGAGAGPQPLYVTGRAYLAGPYKGSPLSLAIVTPAVTGPFDLGTVVVRVALDVDAATGQITARSDSFPTILAGVPLNVRSVTVKMERPGFTLNPTSCEAKVIRGEAISLTGQIAPLASRFQVGGCRGLDFTPKLRLRLKGGTRRGAHPQLRAVLTAKPGEANIGRVVVALPHSEFLDQAHIRTVCTRVQFAGEQCPAGSVYGHVRAITPLLDEPLEGPVYLRSSNNELPDAVAVLKGPPSRPIEIELVGRIDSINGGIRTTIDSVPDAPVSKATLVMQGGKKGLLVNSTNLCSSTHRATVKFNGQNGKIRDFRPILKSDCDTAAHKKR